MAYSSITKPEDYFNTKLYTGNGGTQSITGIGFQPDWTWIKRRDGGTAHHQLFDVIRGATKRIYSSSNAAEDTGSDTLTAFDSDGFSVGANAGVNGNSNTTVSWNWKANGAGSANTDGSINSTVSANTTAGFSIVSYTGTGANATVGHGLGSNVNMVIIKDKSATRDWIVGNTAIGFDKYVLLNSTASSVTASNRFQDTAPSSSVFTIGTHGYVNNSGSNYIAYCFAEKTGYSKFGSYTGNGNADGTFVYTGFKPAFIMTKRIDNTGAWLMYDSKRNPSNLTDKKLLANENGAENASVSPSGVIASTNNIDIVSNGFKQRTTQGYNNASGGNYIYMAFAEEPLVANVGQSIPATAR